MSAPLDWRTYQERLQRRRVYSTLILKYVAITIVLIVGAVAAWVR